MERIKFALRLVGILIIPVIILVISAVIWQNSGIYIEKFSLLGGWWQLEGVRLSSLLIWFLFLGVLLVFSFMLLILSERRLRRELAELQKIKKQKSQTQHGPGAEQNADKSAATETQAGPAGPAAKE